MAHPRDHARWSDAELLSGIAARDPQAFSTFYRRHLRLVLATLARETGDRETAADLAAEVFASVMVAAPRYQAHQDTAHAWLLGISRNVLGHSRRRGRVDDRARRRIGVQALTLGDSDLERVDAALERAGWRCPSSCRRCRRWSARRWSRGLSMSGPTPRSPRSSAVRRRPCATGQPRTGAAAGAVGPGMNDDYFSKLDEQLSTLTSEGAHLDRRARWRPVDRAARRTIAALSLVILLAVLLVIEFPGSASGSQRRVTALTARAAPTGLTAQAAPSAARGQRT